MSDASPDEMVDEYIEAAELYEASGRFVADALTWVYDFGAAYGTVVAVACAAYRESPEFATVVDDILEGEVTL